MLSPKLSVSLLFSMLALPIMLWSQADLSITGYANQTSYAQWSNVVFTFVVTNSGPESATGVTISLPLPSQTAYTSHQVSQGLYDLYYLSWDVGTLAAGEKDSIKLNLFMMGTTNSTIFAQVSASNQSDPDSQPANNNGTTPVQDDEAAITIPPGSGGGGGGGGDPEQADLSMSISTSTPGYNVGTQIPFVVKVSNAGPGQATNIKCAVPVPAGFTFSAVTATGTTYTAATGEWNVGTIPSGGDRTMILNLVATIGGPGKLFAQVTNSSLADPDSAPNNNATTNPVEDDEVAYIVNNLQVDMELDLALGAGQSSVVAIGDTVTIVTTLINKGPSIGENTKVRDIVPAGLQYVSNVASLGAYNDALGVWILGNVPVLEPQTLVLKAKVVSAGPITYIAEVRTCNEPDVDSTPSNFVSGEDDQDELTFTTNGVSNQADLSLTMTATPASVTAGGSTTLNLVASNAGPSQATGVTVSFNLPAGFSVSNTPSGFSGTTWTIGNINSGANASLSLVLTSPISFTAPVSVFAQVQTGSPSDPDSAHGNDTNLSANEDDEALVTLTPSTATPQADISVSLSSNVTSVAANGAVVFTVTASNAGPAAATGVALKFNIPTGIVINTNSTVNGTYASGTWTIGNLASGATATLTLNATANITASNTVFVQVQTASPQDPDSAPGNDTNQSVNEDDEAAVVLTPLVTNQADLSLTLAATPTVVAANGTSTITVTVANAGPSAATGVSVKLNIPAGVTITGNSTTSGSYASDIWTIGGMSNVGSVTLTLQATVNVTAATILFAQIQTATPGDPDSTPGNDTNQSANEDDEKAVTFTLQPQIGASDLSLTVTASNNNPANFTNVIVSVKVFNNGPNDATNVKAKFVLPSGYAYVSSTTADGIYESWIGQWNIGSLPTGDSAVLDVTLFKLNGTTPVNFFSQVQAADQTDADSPHGNDTNNTANEDDEGLLVLPNNGTGGGGGNPPKTCDLALTITSDKTNFDLNDNIVYTLTLTNTGDTTAYGITVKCPLPSSLTLVSATPSAFTGGNWTVGNLAVGASTTISLTTLANSNTAAISVFAQVQTASPTDTDSSPGNDTNQTPNEDDEAVVVVYPVGGGNTVDLELALTSNGSTYAIWNTKEFTLTVTNTGFVPAENVVVSFPFPQYFVYTDKVVSQGEYDVYFKEWNVGTVNVGQTVQCKLTLFNLNNSGPIKAFAQIKEASPDDSDSTPGNNTNDTASEDDESGITITPGAGILQVAEPFGPNDLNPVAMTKAFPNPTEGYMTLRILSAFEGPAHFNIYNSMGQFVQQFEIDVYQGAGNYELSLYDLPTGIYTIMCTDNKQAFHPVRFVKE